MGIVKHHIDADTSKRLRNVCQCIDVNPYMYPEHAIAAVDDSYRALLPGPLVADLEACATGAGPDIMLVRQTPVDFVLPATPLDGKRPSNKYSFATEFTALTFAFLMKMQPFGYESEKAGEFIHQVCPVPGREAYISNEGSKADFGLHTEGPHLEHCPDYVILTCLRGDPEAVTPVLPVWDVLHDLETAHIQTLYSNEFEFRSGASYGAVTTTQQSVLYDHPVFGACIRYHAHNIRPLSFAALRAWEAMQAVLEGKATPVTLYPGDMVIFNNRRVLHGRTGFNPVYDGWQRWLQRVYLTLDFASGPVVPDRKWVWRA